MAKKGDSYEEILEDLIATSQKNAVTFVKKMDFDLPIDINQMPLADRWQYVQAYITLLEERSEALTITLIQILRKLSQDTSQLKIGE